MKKLFAIALSMLMLVGCGGGSSSKKESTEAAAYSFKANGVTVTINQKIDTATLKKVGKYSVYEAPSCAFGDLDRTYTYASYTIDTYSLKDQQYVKNIDLKDDTVTTDEGLSIGSTKKDVESKMGKKYANKNGNLVYTKGKSTLTFQMNGDTVSEILYDFVGL